MKARKIPAYKKIDAHIYICKVKLHSIGEGSDLNTFNV
jgi:hypothetical protein